jgi:hypothetical protein
VGGNRREGEGERVLVCPVRVKKGENGGGDEGKGQEEAAARRKRGDRAQKKLMSMVGKVSLNQTNLI